MHSHEKAMRIAEAVLLFGMMSSMNACSGLSSPLDQAYYTGVDQLSLIGSTSSYTRTIFSPSNF
jgi:hypothetical protein